MADTIYYLIAGDGITYVPCACDRPPTYTTREYSRPPYRDLSGQSGALPEAPGYVTDTDTAAPIVVETDLDGTQVKVTPPMTSLIFMADDVMHAPYRQNDPFVEDIFLFTNAAGDKVGEFPREIYPSYSNRPPNRVPAI